MAERPRRTVLTAWRVGLALASVGASAGAAPPAVNLLVSVRLQPLPPPAEVQPPGGGWQVSTADARAERAPAASLPVLNLRVRNGGQAQAQLGTWQQVQTLQWLWTPQGAGLQGGAQTVPARLRLQVQAEWAGGQAPVRLSHGWEAPLPPAAPDEAAMPGARTAAEVPPTTLAVSGEVWAGWGTWVTVGWLRPADRPPVPTGPGTVWRSSGAAAAASPGWALQLRVLRE